jgi:hypothetical protein
MQFRTVFATAGVLTLFAGLTVIKAQDTLTNSDVVAMTQAGLSEETIIKAIETSKPQFDTSVQALINLKESKVSEQVIQAMLAASKAPPPTSPPASPPAETPKAAPPNTISSLPRERAVQLDESKVKREKQPSGVQTAIAIGGAEAVRDRGYYLLIDMPYAPVWQAVQEISREVEATMADGSSQRVLVDPERGLTQNGSIDRDRLIGRTFGAFANEITIQATQLSENQTQVGVLRRVVKAKAVYERGTEPWERAISNGRWEKWILRRVAERARELAE